MLLESTEPITSRHHARDPRRVEDPGWRVSPLTRPLPEWQPSRPQTYGRHDRADVRRPGPHCRRADQLLPAGDQGQVRGDRLHRRHRVAVDVLRHHRVRVEPVAVQVDIYNPALVAAIEAGKEPDAAAQDPDCWSAQLGFTGEPQDGDAIDLHAAFGRAPVSASLADRPQTALECGYP